ncbi:hypothetical protein J8J42_03335 [Chryseobacterium sp. cx-311]|uniref:hypothetical protein n=1 Tax=Marnyiella aurantia TaxID=2758037 RepID=UPI001AE0F6BF|nr:hypothetical protein [Marnyiella aurantia]MBP0612079.1 hypothetical protein [Marnyiella aurantia]
MKNIKFILSLFLLGLFVFSCREDHTEPVYNGDSFLHFNEGVVRSEFVQIGTASKDVVISYGTIKPVVGSHQVKLVVDPVKTTAVAGTDYEIIKGTDELTNGEVSGTFTVRLKEPVDPALTKSLVFKIESSTIATGVFDNEFTLNWKLQCLIADFMGAFGGFNYTGYWQAPGQYLIEEVPNTPNTLRIVDFLEIGFDLIVSYNDAGVVTFEPQDTGYFHPTYGQTVKIRMSQSNMPGHGNSTIDMCARKLTLIANYYVTQGSFGNKVETFTGF